MNHVSEIANTELRRDHLPSHSDDEPAWISFALTFDGFAHKGGTEKCAAFAQKTRERWESSGVLPSSFNDLRSALFFDHWRWQSSGNESLTEYEWRYWHALVETIRELLPAESQRNRPTLPPTLSSVQYEGVEPAAGETHLRIEGPNAVARAKETADGFVVLAGSVARAETTNSFPKGPKALREGMLREGVLQPTSDGLRFVRNYIFTSPSGAASVVLGRSANGLAQWKDEAGKTLKRIRSESVTTA